MSEVYPVKFEHKQLDALFAALARKGYTIVGPTYQRGHIVLDVLTSAFELPIGWQDHQDKGQYRLVRSDYESYFGCAVGAQSWKKFLYPSRQLLWRSSRVNGSLVIENQKESSPNYAFIGVRGCDLAALKIQRSVRDLRGIDSCPSPFVISVDCFRSVSTCFCASIGTGPSADGAGVDLRLSEIFHSEEEHFFVADPRSERGESILQELVLHPVMKTDLQYREILSRNAAASQVRSLDVNELPAAISESLEVPQWDNIAERCLSCANCTMVCPTCFCTSFEDVTDVTGDHAERWLLWESCFHPNFSYIHGGVVRSSTRSRYRQWFSHKLGSWVAQFGTSGCVGCGRCIAWCPVGIDITEEASKLQQAGERRELLQSKDNA